jgi:hypothetical protein
MAEIKVLYDHVGGNIWACWDDPRKEDICSDADPDADVVLSRDVNGEVIAFENLRFSLKDPADLKVKVHHDKSRKSLTVWFGEPSKENARTNPMHKIVLIKDDNSKVIGVEKLNYTIGDEEDIAVSVETFVDESLMEWIGSRPSSAAAPDR